MTSTRGGFEKRELATFLNSKKEASDQIAAKISPSINKLIGNRACSPPSPLDPPFNNVNVHSFIFLTMHMHRYFASECRLRLWCLTPLSMKLRQMRLLYEYAFLCAYIYMYICILNIQKNILITSYSHSKLANFTIIMNKWTVLK